MAERKHVPTTTNIERAGKAAGKIPNYPGRKQAEAAIRPLVEPWAMRASTAIVMRLIGFWAVWKFTPGGRSAIVRRGWMSRHRAYMAERDFVKLFGVELHEFDLSMLPKFLGTDSTPESTPKG